MTGNRFATSVSSHAWLFVGPEGLPVSRAHAVSRSTVTLPTLTVFAFVFPCASSPNAGGRRRGPKRVVPTAEDEILAVLQSPGVVQYLQRWRLLASTLTCRCRRIVQMQVLRQHTDGYAFRCGHCRQKRCLRTGSIFFA
ncbi:hypothetical protein SprV_0200553500 [Sparganum proliferum]